MYEIIEENVDVKLIIEEVMSKNLLDSETAVNLQKWDKTIFEFEYVNSLIHRFKMYHTRLMRLHPRECYSYHADMAPRIHFPIITNNECFFVLENTTFNMPKGKGYWVDTRKNHTAFNGNKSQTNFIRWHIVGNTDEIF
tara:strand:+ start:9950 stop:10366 length:417 start_codon:yes stop_codon:yes gene_type:complete